jgi:arylsulfatase A-like enzyme
VFTSDHGEMLGSHGCPPTMKQVPWSESAHVPLLLRFPAIHARQGRVVDTPLTTPDILPTLLGLAGVAVPDTIEGDDLSSLVRESREDGERVALYMNVAPFVAREFAKEYRAVRSSRYTYVRGLDGPWLLFDDRQDPSQLDNLIAKPQYAALARQLDDQLQAQLRKIGDDFRPGREYIAAWGYEIGPHGSVPYNTQDPRPQTPQRTPDAR